MYFGIFLAKVGRRYRSSLLEQFLHSEACDALGPRGIRCSHPAGVTGLWFARDDPGMGCYRCPYFAGGPSKCAMAFPQPIGRRLHLCLLLYKSFDEAVAKAGRAVANHWVGVRAALATSLVQDSRRFRGRRDQRCVTTLAASEWVARFQLLQQARHRAAQRRKHTEHTQETRDMPPSLQRNQTSAFLRDGQQLCGPYQVGACTHVLEDDCPAVHRCAIVLKSGRVRGGRHQGDSCWDRRALMVADLPPLPVTSPPQGGYPASGRPSRARPRPSSKKRSQPPPEPLVPPKRQKMAPPEPAGPPPTMVRYTGVASSSSASSSAGNACEARFDLLATLNGRHAERPTKIWESSTGGCLWLSGIPTPLTVNEFPSVDLQLVSLHSLEKKGGVGIPGAAVRHIHLTHRQKRDAQWQSSWPLARRLLLADGQVLIHCVAGKHRAAGLSVVMRALLTKETLAQSHAHILRRRSVEVEKLLTNRSIAAWLHGIYQNAL